MFVKFGVHWLTACHAKALMASLVAAKLNWVSTNLKDSSKRGRASEHVVWLQGGHVVGLLGNVQLGDMPFADLIKHVRRGSRLRQCAVVFATSTRLISGFFANYAISRVAPRLQTWEGERRASAFELL